MMFSLAVVPKPFFDEGLLGYFLRLENVNALSGGELLKAFRALSGAEVALFITNGGRPVGWMEESVELSQPGNRSTRAWTHRNWKFCPRCLREFGYWRGGWSLMLVTCCPVHKIDLLDHCSMCKARLTSQAVRRLRCDSCGAPLANTSDSPPAQPGALWIARELVNRLAGRARGNDVLTRHLGILELHELALRMGVRARVPTGKNSLKLRDAGAHATASPIAQLAGQALTTWPIGFYCLLDSFRKHCSQDKSWKMAHAMGPIYRDVYRHLENSCFDFVRRAFEAYVHHHWQAPLARRNRNLAPRVVRKHHWLSIKEIAAAVGVAPSLLHRMIDSGELSAREMRHPTGRVTRVVDGDAVKALREQLRSALTLEQASSQLGLGEGRVRQLLNSGVLVALGGAPRAGGRWWIDLRGLARCATRNSDVTGRESKSIAIADIAKYRVSDGATFVALIHAIQSGQLAVVSATAPGVEIGKWRVDQDEWASWERSTGKEDKFSISDAAVGLGVKQEVAYALVQNGVLKAVTEKVGRRMAKRITKESLADFRKRYVLGTELAALAGISPRQVAQRMADFGVLPIAGPNVSRCECRQYLWRRSHEVLRIATGESAP